MSTTHTSTPGLAPLMEEVAFYAADFELIRIGVTAGCRRRNPNEALERLWRQVYAAAPAASDEVSRLIVAHRRAVGTFSDLGYRSAASGSGRMHHARVEHYSALAALCTRLLAQHAQGGNGR